MQKNIMTITLNPAVDITLHTDSLYKREIAYIERRYENLGGKGINVSKALRAYGVENVPIVVMGNESNAKFLSLLQDELKNPELIAVRGKVRENYTLVYDNSVTRLDERGFIGDDDLYDKLYSCIKAHLKLGHENLAVFSGSLPVGVSKEKIIELVQNVKELGTSIFFDSSSFEREEIIAMAPHFIKPNDSEFSGMLGKKLDTIDEYIYHATTLLDQKIKSILVSLGERGLIYLDSRHIIRAHVPAVPVQSTTGAGDCSLAGFIAGLASSLPCEECVRLAAAFGTASVMQGGTMAPDADDIGRLAKQIEIETLQ